MDKPSRGRAVAEQVLGDYRPEIWVCDRYAGQQGLVQTHQVCLAHVLRDVQYAIDSDDSITAPKIRDHLRRAICLCSPSVEQNSIRDKKVKNYWHNENVNCEINNNFQFIVFENDVFWRLEK